MDCWIYGLMVLDINPVIQPSINPIILAPLTLMCYIITSREYAMRIICILMRYMRIISRYALQGVSFLNIKMVHAKARTYFRSTMREDIINFSGLKAEESNFHLDLAGISYCDGSYRIARKNSPIFVFEYVIEGSGTLIHSGMKLYPERGDVYIVHKGTDHSYFSSADNPWTKIWFNVGGVLVERLVEAYGLNVVWLVKNCEIRRLFEDGLAYARKKPTDVHEKTAIVIHRIIQAISNELKKREDIHHSEEGLKLKNFIDANFAEIKELDKLSGLIGRSPSQTIRIFKREWKRTPYDYVLEKRIGAAKSLLLGTTFTVKEISSRTGFKDQFYFSNIFKRKTGTAPENYRKANSQ